MCDPHDPERWVKRNADVYCHIIIGRQDLSQHLHYLLIATLPRPLAGLVFAMLNYGKRSMFDVSSGVNGSQVTTASGAFPTRDDILLRLAWREGYEIVRRHYVQRG